MVIGRGSFGKVFLAEHKTTKKLFAVKSIRKDILIQYDQVESTILEKDIMFECDHPFLVGMEYLFQNELRLYFVMPFVRGGELYTFFKAQKRFTEKQVIFYAAQITIAIGYLHLKGIVHRDLKLENILLDEKGYIKIIDFGLAKMLGDNEESMSFCGTPEYLAPEMVSHSGHDKGVDWWALGILIYEMLFGFTPFFNKSREQLLKKIQFAKVVFPDI
jgi:serine/threonine protein kinase